MTLTRGVNFSARQKLKRFYLNPFICILLLAFLSGIIVVRYCDKNGNRAPCANLFRNFILNLRVKKLRVLNIYSHNIWRQHIAPNDAWDNDIFRTTILKRHFWSVNLLLYPSINVSINLFVHQFVYPSTADPGAGIGTGILFIGILKLSFYLVL